MQVEEKPAMAARSINGFTILLFVLVSGFDMAHMTTYNPSCERVDYYFSYCMDFLVEFYYKPSRKCCEHVEKLNMLARHRKGPQFICQCIQDSVKGMQPHLVASRVQDLPLKCQTHLSFPISDSMDCTQYIYSSLISLSLSPTL